MRSAQFSRELCVVVPNAGSSAETPADLLTESSVGSGNRRVGGLVAWTPSTTWSLSTLVNQLTGLMKFVFR